MRVVGRKAKAGNDFATSMGRRLRTVKSNASFSIEIHRLCMSSVPPARRSRGESPGDRLEENPPHGTSKLYAMPQRTDLVLGTAGHIDHGKTSLVRALTGIDTDRLPAEKERGITIDLGFAALELGNFRLAVVDVPGHERFIRNMLAGATGLDLALLVVAADDSVMPQTREHLEILKLLGLRCGVIALSKSDLVDEGWLDLVEDDLRALVRGSFLETAPIIRTSAISGLGLDDLRQALATAAAEVPERSDSGLFRLSVDRAFTISGHGTVVTGTVTSGSVCVGDDLVHHPAERTVRVRGLQRHESAVADVRRGGRAALNLAGVHHTEIGRGDVLASPGYLVPSRLMSVEVRTLHDAPRALRHRGRYRLHVGTAEVPAKLVLLTGGNLQPGEATQGQLLTSEPVSVVWGQPFVLREESPAETLGGGSILQPNARRIRRSDSAARARLERLKSADLAERVRTALAFAGLNGLDERALCRATGVPVEDVPPVLESLQAEGRIIELAGGPRRRQRVTDDLAAELEDRVLRALGRLHAAYPRQSSVRTTHLLAELPDLSPEALVLDLVERLRRAGRVVGDRRSVALKDHEPKLSHGERKLKGELALALRAGGFSPPESSELAAKAGPRSAVVPELLELLTAEGTLVRVGNDLYLDADVEADMKTRVRAALSEGREMAMAELRDLLGTTRKFAVPLGEYLDRAGVTVRSGDVRRLAPQASEPVEAART